MAATLKKTFPKLHIPLLLIFYYSQLSYMATLKAVCIPERHTRNTEFNDSRRKGFMGWNMKPSDYTYAQNLLSSSNNEETTSEREPQAI